MLKRAGVVSGSAMEWREVKSLPSLFSIEALLLHLLRQRQPQRTEGRRASRYSMARRRRFTAARQGRPRLSISTSATRGVSPAVLTRFAPSAAARAIPALPCAGR